MNNRKKQITIGAALSYASILFNILVGLWYTPWIVNQIGESQYGIYTLANSLISLFLIDFGLSSATTRYVSRYHAEGNEKKVNLFLGTIYRLYLIVDSMIIILLIIMFFLSNVIYKNLTPEELHQFKIVYIIAASFSVISFPFVPLNGILSSYELFIQQKLSDVIQRFLTVTFVIAVLLMQKGLYGLVCGNVVAGLVTIAFRLIIIRRYTRVRINYREFDREILRELFAFSLWITIASLSQRLIFNITPSILGMTASSNDIAVFGVITTIEGYTFTITNAINGMFMPKISRIIVGNDTEKNLQPLFLRIGRFQFLLNGLIVSGFYIIGKEFIYLWMGEAFVEAYYGLLFVLIPGLFYNALQIGHTTILVQNKVKIIALINICTGLINVVLSYGLSKQFGVIGASFSIFIAYLFRVAALLLVYNHVLELDIWDFCKKCYIRNIPIILCTIISGIYLKKLILVEDWITFLYVGIIICFLYLGATYFLGFNKVEKNKINQMIIRRFSRI